MPSIGCFFIFCISGSIQVSIKRHYRLSLKKRGKRKHDFYGHSFNDLTQNSDTTTFSIRFPYLLGYQVKCIFSSKGFGGDCLLAIFFLGPTRYCFSCLFMLFLSLISYNPPVIVSNHTYWMVKLRNAIIDSRIKKGFFFFFFLNIIWIIE